MWWLIPLVAIGLSILFIAVTMMVRAERRRKHHEDSSYTAECARMYAELDKILNPNKEH